MTVEDFHPNSRFSSCATMWLMCCCELLAAGKQSGIILLGVKHLKDATLDLGLSHWQWFKKVRGTASKNLVGAVLQIIIITSNKQIYMQSTVTWDQCNYVRGEISASQLHQYVNRFHLNLFMD